MQVVLHIIARSSLKESLRELVIEDLQKWEFQLQIESEKKVGRRGGWAKIKAADLSGVINITWLPSSKTLVARAISRGENTPDELVGRFVAYLLQRRRKQLNGIVIRPS